MFRSSFCGALVLLLASGCASEAPRSGALRSTVATKVSPPPVVPKTSAPPAKAPEETLPELDLFAHLAGPSLEDWTPAYTPSPLAIPPTFPKVAVITAATVPLYADPDGRYVVGYSALSQELPAREVSGKGCEGGQWYAVSGNAYLCSADGAKVVDAALKATLLDASMRRRVPHLARPNPYRYGKARRGAHLFARVPTAAELAMKKLPADLETQTLDGTYLLAMADPAEGPKRYLETLQGHFIAKEDWTVFPDSPMHGEKLGKKWKLPLAFTFQEAPLRCLRQEGEPVRCGTAEKHARFPAGEVVTDDGSQWMLVRDDVQIPLDAVRVARKVARPKGVGRRERWIHINLSEQTLVAYQGDKPVFATLVSTGKPGHDTPTGLYEVNRKFLSKPMNGTDDDGPYQVQEVPWTMYFHGNYAVHGAYWHDIFGHTRSHGCVNVPPADARWLFYWSDPKLPEGWSGMLHAEGVHVYITGKTPPPDPGEKTVAKNG
jgi:hypothetical protein